MKKFEQELPEGYKEDRVIDEKDTKFQIIINLISLGLIVAIILVGILIHNKMYPSQDSIFKNSKFIVYIVLFIVFYLLVNFLHEILQGLIIKLITRQKLKFKFSIINTYYGNPDLYIYKSKTVLINILPTLIISLLLLIPVLVIVDSLGFLFTLIIFAIHFAGSLTDIYFAFLLLIKYHKKNVLVKDTGNKKIIYVKEEE